MGWLKGELMLSSIRLYYKAGNSNIVIKTYTSLSDIYTGKGLPLNYKGETFYAPLVSLSDIYSSPIRVTKNGETLAVAYDTVGKVQRHDFNNTVKIELSGSREKEVTYGSFYIVAPKSGNYRLQSIIVGGQNGWGYSGDSWQWSYWYLDLDGNNFYTARYVRSQGMGQKTLYNNVIYLQGGTHTITLRIRGKCSSKDSHLTQCDSWKNTITME